MSHMKGLHGLVQLKNTVSQQFLVCMSLHNMTQVQLNCPYKIKEVVFQLAGLL